MWKRYKQSLEICLIVFTLVWIGILHYAHAENVIYPGNPPSNISGDIKWYPDIRKDAYAQITKNQPRAGKSYPGYISPGYASLELHTSGTTNTGVFDWAFYNRYADDKSSGWGFLSEVTGLSFDWFRATDYRQDDTIWNAQTPLIRIYINDDGILSELVWEKWYTDLYNTNPADRDIWIEQDIFNGYYTEMWRHVFGTTLGDNGTYTAVLEGTTTIAEVQNIGYNPLVTYSISAWVSAFNDTKQENYYSHDAFVYGIGVGVGSNWPHEYIGYVDNIYLKFGQSAPIVQDNFDVPEPSSVILLICGLVFIIRGRSFCGKESER